MLYEDPDTFFSIGAEINDATVPLGFFNGAIAHVVVFPTALSGTAVAALPTTGGYAGAIGTWLLNDGSGTAVRDSSMTRADGTFVNGSWNTETTAPFCR